MGSAACCPPIRQFSLLENTKYDIAKIRGICRLEDRCNFSGGGKEGVPLLEAAASPKRLIADKACDADRIRRWRAERRITAVIPSTTTRHTPYSLNRRVYRCRNQIQRLFCRLKNRRRTATKYDRLPRNYFASLALAVVSEQAK